MLAGGTRTASSSREQGEPGRPPPGSSPEPPGARPQARGHRTGTRSLLAPLPLPGSYETSGPPSPLIGVISVGPLEERLAVAGRIQFSDVELGDVDHALIGTALQWRRHPNMVVQPSPPDAGLPWRRRRASGACCPTLHISQPAGWGLPGSLARVVAGLGRRCACPRRRAPVRIVRIRPSFSAQRPSA
jgi:hypothetical protein